MITRSLVRTKLREFTMCNPPGRGNRERLRRIRCSEVPILCVPLVERLFGEIRMLRAGVTGSNVR